MHELIEQLPGVVYEYYINPDDRGVFTYVSSNSRRILGLDAAALMGNPDSFESIIFLEDRASFKSAKGKGYNKNDFWSWEGRITVRGETRWIEIRSTPGDKNRRHGLMLDITDRKLKEQEAERATKRNETLFTHLFQSLPIGVVMLDEGGKVEMINKGFYEMFGYELESLRGHNLNDYIVPEELRIEGIDLNNLITSNKVIMVETTRKHREGTLIDVLLYGVPVTFENRTIGIYGVYVNISDRKKVEEELKVRNAELDNFVYKVSHDLRAPLSSILGLVNLAQLPGNNDDPKDYIDIIGNKVAHLDHFIGDVLSHSKNLKMELSTVRVDFHEVISRTFTDLSYLDGASEVMVYRKVEGSEFYGDPWRVQEIFRNLVSNSIKYRSHDHSRPEIKIEISVDSRKAEIIFADNGIGIDELNLNRIFEMFYRATEQSNGSGIGLYIVKNAVDRLGGLIHVDSKPGLGTTFKITLPNQIDDLKVEPTFRFAVDKS